MPDEIPALRALVEQVLVRVQRMAEGGGQHVASRQEWSRHVGVAQADYHLRLAAEALRQAKEEKCPPQSPT